MRNKNIDIISDQLAGELAEEDRAHLDCWKESDSDNERFLQALTSPSQSSDEIEEKGEEARMKVLLTVQQRIKAVRRKFVWLKIGAVAASVALLLMFSNYYSFQSGKKQTGSQLLEVSNPRGMLSTITLPDGTKVTLNGGATLSYPTLFIAENREVSLSGEAYFDVKKDEKQPFIVHAEDLQVKVLGTQFNVKSYQEDDYIQITLNEGKVGVNVASEQEIEYLQPDQQVCFDKKNRTFTKEDVNARFFSAWKDGQLYFRGTPFYEVALQLERRFNVDIEIVSPKLRETSYYGEFVRGENLDQILQVMILDRRIGYSIKGDQVRIYEK